MDFSCAIYIYVNNCGWIAANNGNYIDIWGGVNWCLIDNQWQSFGQYIFTMLKCFDEISLNECHISLLP